MIIGEETFNKLFLAVIRGLKAGKQWRDLEVETGTSARILARIYKQGCKARGVQPTKRARGEVERNLKILEMRKTMTPKEISRALGMSRSTVCGVLFRARAAAERSAASKPPAPANWPAGTHPKLGIKR